MHLRTLACLVALISPISATVAGCGHKTPPLVVDGFTLNPDPWLTDRQALLQRASFDLACDPNTLQLRVLAVGGYGIYDDWASQVGVMGCDKRVTYLRTLSGWVANTVGSNAK